MGWGRGWGFGERNDENPKEERERSDVGAGPSPVS